MENYFKITDAIELAKIFEMGQNKLIVLMFYSKNVPACRRCVPFFESIAVNHNLSLFCLIDMDKFDGDSKYVGNITNMPKFDAYYAGNPLSSTGATNDKEIEKFVAGGEQYILTQLGNKNKIMTDQTQPQTLSFDINYQINPQQIQYQILQTMQVQNPQNYQYLIQNPEALQQLVQKQIIYRQQQIQMQQQRQQPMQPTVPIMQPMQPMQQPMQSMQQPMQAMQQPMQPLQIPPMISQSMIPMMQQPIQNQWVQQQQQQPDIDNTVNTTNNILPTFQQMQQMFQIWQMMQQMGVLVTPGSSASQSTAIPTSAESESHLQPNEENTLILPNGDKLISMPGGKYGLIKKKN